MIGIVAALGLGGYWLRRWIVPEFSGALARLADATIAVALLVLSLELLGTLSILRLGWIVVVCIAVGLLRGAARLAHGADRGPREVGAPKVQTIALLIALGVASFTVAEWTFPSQLSLDQGMFGGDTTWYHMPFAATMAQEHSTVHLHFTDPLRLAAWFYPQSSELIHAAAIVLFKSDWLSPLINLFWLAIALLAAWCVGRPYKVGPATLVAGAIILDAGVMIETQPGEGRNDIMGLAFLIAFAAFLINGHQRRAPKAGAVQDAPERDAPLLDKGPLVDRRDRRRPGRLGQVHLPDPGRGDHDRRRRLQRQGAALDDRLGAGPLDARGRRLLVPAGGDQDRRQPDPDIELRAAAPAARPTRCRSTRGRASPSPTTSTNPTIYRRWFFPQLDNAFGPLWPLILIIAVAAAVFIAVRSRNRILRVIAVARAADRRRLRLHAADRGRPGGLADRLLHQHPLPGPGPGAGDGAAADRAAAAGARGQRAWQTLLFLAAVYAITVLTTPRWYPGYIVGTIFLTLALVWAPAALGPARARRLVSRAGGRDRDRRRRPALAVVLGRAQEVQYDDHHYTEVDHFLQDGGPKKAYTFARKQHDKRIGIAGSGEIFFGQYGFYGENLDNYVQYIGVGGPNGTYRLPTSCPQFRRLINDGEYDYLIISQYTQDTEDGPYNYPIYAWVKNDPALELLITEEPTSTPSPTTSSRSTASSTPSGCAAQKRA